MAQRARRHWAISEKRTRGIGGHGAESEIFKVVVYMAILTIFNIPQLISRFGLGSELLHFNLPQPQTMSRPSHVEPSLV